MLKRLALKYWPVAVLFTCIVTVLCMSRYAGLTEHPASWVETFAWPNGVTAWALLLTLLAIAWQSAETRAAARATEESVTLAADTAKRQLRAYLGVNEACVKITANEAIDGQPWVRLEAQLHIKNGGQTPAYSIESWLYGQIGTYPENTPVPLPPKGMPRGIAIIPAQGKNIFTSKEIMIFPPIMEDRRKMMEVLFKDLRGRK